jgi:hypothetical protein
MHESLDDLRILKVGWAGFAGRAAYYTSDLGFAVPTRGLIFAHIPA